MSNLQTYHHFKLDFQNFDQHTEGKWLIHGTERRKGNQLQSQKHPGSCAFAEPELLRWRQPKAQFNSN